MRTKREKYDMQVVAKLKMKIVSNEMILSRDIKDARFVSNDLIDA